jgi:hypothetical protein
VIKFTSCLPIDGGSLRVLRLLPLYLLNKQISQCQIKDLFAPGFILVTYLETLLQNIFDLILFFLCVLTPLSASRQFFVYLREIIQKTQPTQKGLISKAILAKKVFVAYCVDCFN